MTFDPTKPLKRAAGQIVPQYWNDDIEDWEVVKGAEGAYRSQNAVEISEEPFSSSGSLTKEFTSAMSGIVISNDGNADLTFTVNAKTYTVKAGEVYEGRFRPFTTITVTSTVPWRAEALQLYGISQTVEPTPVDTTAPDNVTNLVASNISTTGLTLTWTASASSDCVGYDIYRGATLIGSIAETTYAATGLTGSTQYTFTVKAKDAAGNIATGESITVTTDISTDTTPPNNVTGLTAINVTDTTLTLSWSVSSSSDVASYDVYQGETYLGTATGTTYNVASLTPSTQYTFTVKAKDSSNNLASGTSVTTTTAPLADMTAPNPVTGLTAGTPTSSTIPISWTLSTSDDVAKLEVAYSTDGTNFTVASAAVSASSTTYTLTGLATNTSYTVRVVAIDGSSNRSTASTVQTSTSASAGKVSDASLLYYVDNPTIGTIVPNPNNYFVGSIPFTLESSYQPIVNGSNAANAIVNRFTMSAPDNVFKLEFTWNNQIAATLYGTNPTTSATSTPAVTAAGPFTDYTKYYHIALVWDGSKLSLYVDNAKASEVNLTTSGFAFNSSAQSLTLGTSGRSGNIKNVAYYNRALSSAELTQNYNALK